MSKVLKVVFADDNKDFCEIISDYFSVIQDIEIVAIANDGSRAYTMIMQHEPDIAILDIIMPRVDGLGVLEKLNANPPRKMPKVFILSALGHDNITKRVISLGAQYYFIKPFDLELLADRIRQLGSSANPAIPLNASSSLGSNNSFDTNDEQFFSNEIEKNVTNAIHRMGVPAHIKGFQFLRDAIIMVTKDINTINSITKIVYPAVAKMHDTSATNVERGIRHAIEVAWRRGETDTHNRLFGDTLDNEKERPTNSEFIAMISDKLRLEMKA